MENRKFCEENQCGCYNVNKLIMENTYNGL